MPLPNVRDWCCRVYGLVFFNIRADFVLSLNENQVYYKSNPLSPSVDAYSDLQPLGHRWGFRLGQFHVLDRVPKNPHSRDRVPHIEGKVGHVFRVKLIGNRSTCAQRILSLKFEHISDGKHPAFHEIFLIIVIPFLIIGNQLPNDGNPFQLSWEYFHFY